MYEEARKTYLGGGKPPPEGGYGVVFNCPLGIYPKLIDVALRYGMFKSNIHRRYANESEDFQEWHPIYSPTEEQQIQAINNVNALYIELYEESDNCPLCNEIDDLLFAEHCWVNTVRHDHASDDINNIKIYYSFRGKDYSVTYLDWVVDNIRPHLTGERA